MRSVRRGSALAGYAFALVVSIAPAQQPAASTPQEPQAPKQVQPRGEQVHTGVTSGLDAETRLEALIADHQFSLVAAQLDKLPTEQAQLFRGILANRNNDAKSSIELLVPLVDQVAAGGNLAEEKLLRKTLAEDYLRTGDMADAAKAYEALAERLQGHLSTEELDEIELPLKLAALAANHPRTTA